MGDQVGAGWTRVDVFQETAGGGLKSHARVRAELGRSLPVNLPEVDHALVNAGLERSPSREW